jgi:hypothetical protein
MHMHKSFTDRALLAAALALLALAAYAWPQAGDAAGPRSYRIDDRVLTGKPGDVLRGNDSTDNAAIFAEVGLAPDLGGPVRAWLVREAVAAAEPDWPDCETRSGPCLGEIRLDPDLRILYRPRGATRSGTPAARQAALRDWFAERLEPAESAR